MTQNLDQIFQELNPMLNGVELALNDQRVCQITVDGRLTIFIEEDSSMEVVHIYTTLLPADAFDRKELFARLLQAQLFVAEVGCGMLFGLDEDTGDILLQMQLEISRLDAGYLFGKLEEFINWAFHWMEELQQGKQAASSENIGSLADFLRA